MAVVSCLPTRESRKRSGRRRKRRPWRAYEMDGWVRESGSRHGWARGGLVMPAGALIWGKEWEKDNDWCDAMHVSHVRRLAGEWGWRCEAKHLV